MTSVVVAALAVLIAPATALATSAPTPTESGSPLAVGTKLVGTNVGETTLITTGGSALLHCPNALMTGEVVKNSGGAVEGTLTTADVWGTGATHPHNNLPECTGSFGNIYMTIVNSHLCIRSTPAMVTHEFQISGGACPGAEKVKFVLGSTSIRACEYESTGAIKGDYTTGAHDTLTVRNTSAGSGVSKIKGSFLCPASGALQMTFALETHDGTTVTIS